VLITSTRADHIFGIDELRCFNRDDSLSVFASPLQVQDLRKRFGYAFGGPVLQRGGGIPQLKLTEVDTIFEIDSIRFDPIPLICREEAANGYRFGNFAYLTGGNGLSDESYAKLNGVELLVLGASNPQKTGLTFSFATACEVLERIRPKRAWFTHMSHRVTFAQAERWIQEAQRERPLLKGIEIHPGYDGLRIEGLKI
jgi:phosphoribosyl 1,2-cyclic phosphate phosphodiesterase